MWPKNFILPLPLLRRHIEFMEADANPSKTVTTVAVLIEIALTLSFLVIITRLSSSKSASLLTSESYITLHYKQSIKYRTSKVFFFLRMINLATCNASLNCCWSFNHQVYTYTLSSIINKFLKNLLILTYGRMYAPQEKKNVRLVIKEHLIISRYYQLQ